MNDFLKDLPFFINQKTLMQLIWWFGILFPGLLIYSFFYLYNKSQKNRNKEIEDNKKNLVNLKEKTKSNGVGDHYKKKYE